MSDKNPKEFWVIEDPFSGAVAVSRKPEKDAIHVIEKSAYQWLMDQRAKDWPHSKQHYEERYQEHKLKIEALLVINQKYKDALNVGAVLGDFAPGIGTHNSFMPASRCQQMQDAAMKVYRAQYYAVTECSDLAGIEGEG